MRLRFRYRSITLLVVLSVLLVLVPGVAAAEPRAGGSIVIAEGETVDGLETFAGSVFVKGTIDGDLSAFAGDVTVAETGHVTGQVQSAAGSVRIAGTVDGDVSGAAGDITVTEGATIGGDLDAGAGTVRILGTIRGDGTVGAEEIVLGPKASVEGDLTYDGRLVGERSAVAGTIERDTALGGPMVFQPVVPGFGDVILGVYGFLVNLLLGALLLIVFPAFSARVAQRAIDSPVRSGGIGLLGLVGIPVLLGLVAVTIIGIPLTIVGAILFGILAWIGSVYGRIAVGTWVLSHSDVDNRWAALLIGFLVVAVAVRIPWLGELMQLLVFLLGFGALVLVANDRRRTRRKSIEYSTVGGGTPA